MPSVGFSSKWKLTQDTSFLHQQVLRGLDTVPWVDHTRVAALGYRFGANVAVRLAFLEAQRLRGVATLGPIVHALLANPAQQTHVPDMYIDVLASRLGMAHATDETLSAELNRYSLKTQGLLGRRTPTPMLAGYWQNDPWSPEEDARLIVNSSASGKLLPIGFSPVLNNFDRALQTTCDWLLQQLK
ncbi:alpha/beta hydrolase, partial [Mixta calida]